MKTLTPAKNRYFDAYCGRKAKPLYWQTEHDGRQNLLGIDCEKRIVLIDLRKIKPRMMAELKRTVRWEPMREPLYIDKLTPGPSPR